MIPAKVTKFSGRVEIARNFDWKWVKVVDNMLVQEGDWIRTRAKSSVEVMQDDGTVIVLRPNTKIMFEIYLDTTYTQKHEATYYTELGEAQKGPAITRAVAGTHVYDGFINEWRSDEAKALDAFERALAVNPHIPLAQSEVKRLKKKVKGEKI